MSIASELNNLEGNIEDSYDAVNDMGGIIPAQRNMDNLDQAIRTIPQSQGTTYTAGYGIDIDQNDEISVDTSVIAEKTDIPTNTSDLTNDGSDGTSTYVEASDLATVATSGDYGDLLNTPTIPANTSDLTNDGDDGVHPFLATDDVATVATSGLYSDLTGTPTIPTNTSDLVNNGSDGTSTYVEADDLATVATSGLYSDLTGTPTIPAAQVNSDWNANSGVEQILNKPSLATVATSGSYNDLSNKPTIPAAQVNSDWNSTSGVSQILNRPGIKNATAQTHTDYNNNQDYLPNMRFLSFWNGAYNSSGNSNLSHLASNAVQTANINNSAVTTAKLATSTWVNGSYHSGFKASTNTSYKQNIQATIVGRMLYIRFGVSPSSGSFAKDTEYTFGSIPSTVNGVTVSGLCTSAKQNLPRFLCSGQYGMYGWCQLNGTNLSLSFNSSMGNSCGWMCGQLMIPIDY